MNSSLKEIPKKKEEKEIFCVLSFINSSPYSKEARKKEARALWRAPLF
jgi:hypothetical protein